MLWKPFTCTRHVTSRCNLSSIIYKGIESPFFLFRPLTKLPHPNTDRPLDVVVKLSRSTYILGGEISRTSHDFTKRLPKASLGELGEPIPARNNYPQST